MYYLTGVQSPKEFTVTVLFLYYITTVSLLYHRCICTVFVLYHYCTLLYFITTVSLFWSLWSPLHCVPGFRPFLTLSDLVLPPRSRVLRYPGRLILLDSLPVSVHIVHFAAIRHFKFLPVGSCKYRDRTTCAVSCRSESSNTSLVVL